MLVDGINSRIAVMEAKNYSISQFVFIYKDDTGVRRGAFFTVYRTVEMAWAPNGLRLDNCVLPFPLVTY